MCGIALRSFVGAGLVSLLRLLASVGRFSAGIRTEMALNVLAYNPTRVMNIIGIRPLMAAIRA